MVKSRLFLTDHMKITPHCQDHTRNGGKVATQASTKRTSLMLGNDSDETQTVFKTVCGRRDDQRSESNVELTKLFPMTVQADRNGGVRVFGDSKTKSRA